MFVYYTGKGNPLNRRTFVFCMYFIYRCKYVNIYVFYNSLCVNIRFLIFQKLVLHLRDSQVIFLFNHSCTLYFIVEPLPPGTIPSPSRPSWTSSSSSILNFTTFVTYFRLNWCRTRYLESLTGPVSYSRRNPLEPSWLTNVIHILPPRNTYGSVP